jgi:PTS system nitrogen regulatory IIA component
LAIQVSKGVTIGKYLDARQVVFLNVKTRDEVLRSLVELLEKCGKLHDREKYYRAILEREKIVSTGVGMGVAIPHAKLIDYEQFFVAIGIQKIPGVEWNSLDNVPVRLIFMIGGPDQKQTEYLHILSRITMAIKDGERRKKLLNAKTAEEVISLFEGW